MLSAQHFLEKVNEQLRPEQRLTRRTLQLYSSPSLRLLPSPKHGRHHRSSYDEEWVAVVVCIRRLQSKGYSLDKMVRLTQVVPLSRHAGRLLKAPDDNVATLFSVSQVGWFDPIMANLRSDSALAGFLEAVTQRDMDGKVTEIICKLAHGQVPLLKQESDRVRHERTERLKERAERIAEFLERPSEVARATEMVGVVSRKVRKPLAEVAELFVRLLLDAPPELFEKYVRNVMALRSSLEPLLDTRVKGKPLASDK